MGAVSVGEHQLGLGAAFALVLIAFLMIAIPRFKFRYQQFMKFLQRRDAEYQRKKQEEAAKGETKKEE
eukprot:874855-Prorocentrum_minimum.AAC.4